MGWFRGNCHGFALQNLPKWGCRWGWILGANYGSSSAEFSATTLELFPCNYGSSSTQGLVVLKVAFRNQRCNRKSEGFSLVFLPSTNGELSWKTCLIKPDSVCGLFDPTSKWTLDIARTTCATGEAGEATEWSHQVAAAYFAAWLTIPSVETIRSL